MDLAKTLVRSVARAFYETKHILIVDALIIHSALRDDDLAYLISMNIKDLHKMCQKLKEDRLLASHSRSELREGQQRPNNRTYYYIDYRQTIDAIKWRVYKIDKDMQGPVVPPSEKKEYFCDHCKAEWTQMEVLDSFGPLGFVCHRCGTVLRHGDSGQSGGHERSTRMNNQFKFITELLPKIDSVVIPDNNFEVAFNNKRPVVRDSTHQTASFIGVDAMNRPTAVKGLANTGPSTLSVSIQAGDGPTEEEQAAERAQRERVAQQNALPSWMSNSTVTGEAFKMDTISLSRAAASSAAGGADGNGGAGDGSEDTKDPAIKASSDTNAEAAIDDYFSRLKKQAAEEAQKKAGGEEEEEEDDDEEDDEEFEFEDVPQSGSNATSDVGTPTPIPTVRTPPRSVPSALGGVGSANAYSNLPKAPSPLRQSHSQTSLKRGASGEPPSPTAGHINGHLAASNSQSPDASRPAKKPRVDGNEYGAGSASGKAAGVKAEAEDSEDDDDDIEFEDV